MKTLKHIKVLRIDEEMLNTFKNMKSLKIDVGKFIRLAIKEKLEKEHKYFKPKEIEDSFSIRLKKAILANHKKHKKHEKR